MDTDLTGFQIDLLVDPFHHANYQVDHSVLTERVDDGAGLGIERHQPITRRDIEHALVTSSVGPVPHATARKLTRSVGGSLAFAEAVRPDQLSRFPVEGDNGPPGAAGRVQQDR